MKVLVMCIVSVLFVSKAFASENQSTDIADFDESKEVNVIIQNVLPEELGMEAVDRIKKSFYSQHPCTSCGYNQNQYSQQPISVISPYPGNYHNLPPRTNYNRPDPGYLPNPNYQQPTYNSYNDNKYPTTSYTSPSNFYPQSYQSPYGATSSKILVGCQPHITLIPDGVYLNQPSYNQPSNNQPLYNQLNQPLNNQATYSQPPHSQPSYNQALNSQPTYSQPTYSQPTYSQPTYSQPPYNHQPFSQPPYSQPLHSQAIYSQPSLRQPYSHPPQIQNTHRSQEDSTLSATHNSDANTNEKMPEKFDLSNNSQPKGNTTPTKDNFVSQPMSTKTDEKSNTNDTVQSANSIEEAKLQQQDTIYKMAKYQSQLAKNMVMKENLQKKESTAGD